MTSSAPSAPAPVPAPAEQRARTSRVDRTPAWLYPFKGLAYFLIHPHLYPLLRERLLPCFLLSVFVLVLLFTFTYLPQVAFLALFHGTAGAWLNGTILVLGEAAVVVALLFEAFFADEAQVDIFDAVLVAHGLDSLVESSRPVLPHDPEGTNTPVKRLGKPRRSAVYAPFSFRQIFEFIVLLPVNLIPYVGVPLFLMATGWRAGPLLHWRYMILRGLNKKEREEWVLKRRADYTWFGTAALLLQLVPVISMFFLLTTAAGSALWAAKMEHQRLQAEAEGGGESDYRDDPV